MASRLHLLAAVSLWLRGALPKTGVGACRRDVTMQFGSVLELSPVQLGLSFGSWDLISTSSV